MNTYNQKGPGSAVALAKQIGLIVPGSKPGSGKFYIFRYPIPFFIRFI